MLNVRHSISMHDIYETCIDQYKPFIRHVATATSNTKNVRSDESDGCNYATMFQLSSGLDLNNVVYHLTSIIHLTSFKPRRSYVPLS